MAKTLIEQAEPHIREIVRICRVLEAEGRELDELNDLVGRTIQNCLVGSNGGTDDPRPIDIKFKLLRRSGRQASQTKRSYENMQGADSRASGLPKKQKLATDKPATDESATDESATDKSTIDESATDESATDEPATDEPATDEPAIEEPTTDEPATDEPATDEPATDESASDEPAIEEPTTDEPATDKPATDKSTTDESATDEPAIEEPTTDEPATNERAIESTTLESTDSPAIIEPNTMESLRTSREDRSSDTGIVDNGLPDADKQRPFARRSILDGAVQLLEDVVVALKHVDDKSRIPDSSVPGILDDVLTTAIIRTNFVNIMSSVTEKWARCNRLIAKPALEYAQESLGKANQKKKKTREEQAMSEERLRHAVACCDVRELSKIAMQDLLSEPAELMGEFSDESDYENVMKHIERESTNDTRTQLRRLWKETYYWPMIQQRAKMIGPLPKSSGPKTEITPQEKLAAKKLIVAMGHGESRNSIFKWTSYLRLLSDLRDRGTTAFLLCRTSEFKTYFFQHPKELDMLLSWHKVYDFPLRQLRLRVIAEEANDFSGKSDIEEEWLRDRLHAPQNIRWGDHLSAWDQDSTEYENFLADHSLKPTSGKSNTYVLRHGIKAQFGRNMAIYVSFVPYEGEPDKRTFSNKTASTELLAVAPLVAVAPGDFLGIFPGRLRYTDQKPTRAIRGPVPNLWLDHSEAMGKLNKMKVAKAGEMTNVCLAWEGVNEVKGEKSFCQYLRVLVIATRHILPFDQLVRPSSGTAVRSGEDGRLGSRGRE